MRWPFGKKRGEAERDAQEEEAFLQRIRELV